MTTITEYLTTFLKVQRSLIERLAPESSYGKGYNQAIQDVMDAIARYEELQKIDLQGK